MRAFGIVAAFCVVAALLIAVARPAWAQDRARVEDGRLAFMKQGCYGLRDPSSVRPSAHMPTLELSEDDIRALAEFLAAQQ